MNPQRKRSRERESKWADPGRFQYLSELKNEFETTASADARQQVIANLANFAYNPENFDHLFRLAVHQLFWTNIDSTDDFVALTSLKGLCNFAPYEPIALFCSQANILEKVFNCMKDKMWSADFVIHSLLLQITLRLSQHTTLDQKTQAKWNKAVNEIPANIMEDNRVKNLVHIILNDTQEPIKSNFN